MALPDRVVSSTPTLIISSHDACNKTIGVLPSLDLRGKESEKWQESRVTRLDVEGSRHLRAATAATGRKSGRHGSSDHGIEQHQVPWTLKGQI
ncbi:hypothetical protein CRG98_007649 [Punica granatum]|uniref:Uncharacterized protein n=1 Tax=Punica granatum TaxID=22663 RepID=A0A2I0KVS9_PUNGR|nr:hypothetical protein CRG98_007649 [Punica granatum]